MTASRPNSQAVRLDRVSVRYSGVAAIQDISLDLPAGLILALLGPSGCGKSTLLRSVAGFVPHTGEVEIGSRSMSRVQPHHRNIGMVFQDYALFPHMTVGENVGFGLKMRGIDRAESSRRVNQTLALVGLEGFEKRMVRQLSGGQQQRVALARALVVEPAVLLLDEPLSALDKKLREEMRIELKRIQRLTGVTTIFVTHDQDEALGLADLMALMHRGNLLQVGAPEQVYRYPVNQFAAQFLGATNVAEAICRERRADTILLEIPGAGFVEARLPREVPSPGDRVYIFVRPERIGLAGQHLEGASPALPATVLARTYFGRHVEFTLKLADSKTWTANAGDEAGVAAILAGMPLSLHIAPSDVIVFPAGDRKPPNAQ